MRTTLGMELGCHFEATQHVGSTGPLSIMYGQCIFGVFFSQYPTNVRYSCVGVCHFSEGEVESMVSNQRRPLVAVFQLVIAVVLVACTTGLLNILAIHLLNRHSLTDHLHQAVVVCKDF